MILDISKHWRHNYILGCLLAKIYCIQPSTFNLVIQISQFTQLVLWAGLTNEIMAPNS